MAYSGTFKPKNPGKYQGNHNNIIYRSLWELHCFKWADSNPEVKKWSSEEIVIPYVWSIDGNWHRYFVDMKIVYQSDRVQLVEIKPHKETQKPVYPGRKTKNYIKESLTYVKNQNKWEAAKKYAKKRNWEFVVWTEHTLDKMGIMKKQKKLKPVGKKLGTVRAKKGFKKMKPFPKFGG